MNSLITVDVEDAINLNLRDRFDINIAPTNRVVANTSKILQLLNDKQVKATFFVLGEVAEEFPNLIRNIHREGHELGVHGYYHKLFDKNDSNIIFSEIERAKKIIEDISGDKVFGHRAPAFSVNNNTPWAFETIRKAGFLYDSSVVVNKSFHYGWPGFNSEIGKIETSFGSLIEVPINTIKILNHYVPYFGGSALRLLPKAFMNNIIKRGVKLDYLMLYVHPYEIDFDFKNYPEFYLEKIHNSGIKNLFALKLNWLNRKSVLKKMNFILDETENYSIIDYLKIKNHYVS